MRRIIIAMLLILAFTPAITVHAESTTREVKVYLYHDYTDCVFLVSWADAEQTAAIQIKDPDGVVIDANTANTDFGNGQASVSVGTAKSGYWYVLVTGENLGTINISGGSKNAMSSQYNAIQSFDAEVSGGYINFKWNVTAEQDTINITINASQGSSYSSSYSGSYGSRTIWNDYSAASNGTASVSSDELQTGLYSFTIQVFDGEGQYTLSIDEPLYVKQSNAPARLEGVRAGSIDGEMYATWNASSNNPYFVTLYEYDTLAVIKTEWSDANFYSVILTEGLDKVKFSVQSTDGETYSEFDIFEIISSTPAGTITFPDYTTTRESIISVKVDCPPDVTAGVYLDGTLLLDQAGTGDYDLNLSEGIHNVVAFVKDSYGNITTFSKSIIVDKTPPVVNLNNADSVKTAADYIVVDGSTEPSAIVAINGVEQELGTGSFMAKLALSEGINPISVTAYDLAGNKSIKTITAERADAFSDDRAVYIIPGIIFIFLTAWYILLNKKQKEAKPDEKAI